MPGVMNGDIEISDLRARRVVRQGLTIQKVGVGKGCSLKLRIFYNDSHKRETLEQETRPLPEGMKSYMLGECASSSVGDPEDRLGKKEFHSISRRLANFATCAMHEGSGQYWQLWLTYYESLMGQSWKGEKVVENMGITMADPSLVQARDPVRQGTALVLLLLSLIGN